MIEQAQMLLARGPSTVVVTSAELEDTPGRRDRDRCDRTDQGRIKSLARAHAETTHQPSGTGDLFASLLVSRAFGIEHAGGAGPRRVRHLRRAGTHRAHGTEECASSRALSC